MGTNNIIEYSKNDPGKTEYLHNDLVAVCKDISVNSGGNVYLGRKFTGCEVVVLVIRK